MLSSSREQEIFEDLQISRPRQRTSKCVFDAKDVLRNSTSAMVVAHNKIKTILSNITFADPPIDC